MKSTPERRQTELLETLRALRLLVKEIGGNYLAGLQAGVAHIEQVVLAAGRDRRPGPKQLAQLAAMRKLIHTLDVDPQKGRRRDLKALDRLIRKLSDRVESW